MLFVTYLYWELLIAFKKDLTISIAGLGVCNLGRLSKVDNHTKRKLYMKLICLKPTLPDIQLDC